jgi:hypothetical protein
MRGREVKEEREKSEEEEIRMRGQFYIFIFFVGGKVGEFSIISHVL